MTELTLTPGLFAVPTPAGAYRAATVDGGGSRERLLRALLRSPRPLQLHEAQLVEWTGARSARDALEVLADTQSAGWVEGRTEPPEPPDGPLGLTLPELLAPLSETAHAALVDDQGFGLASVGFSPEAETELSALSAEIARLGQRRGAIGISLGATDGWAVVDRHGASSTAFYPLMTGTQQFVLILGGAPRLNHPAFVTLMWALGMRYDATPDSPADPPDAADTNGSQPHAARPTATRSPTPTPAAGPATTTPRR